MAQLGETNEWQQAVQHKHPELQYQFIADSLNKAAGSVSGEGQKDDPRYQEVKNSRMELLEIDADSGYNCSAATRKICLTHSLSWSWSVEEHGR